jgi:hypothetical protein
VTDAGRPEPARRLGERATLEGWLEYHRATLEQRCAGLTPQQLASRSVPPSTLSLLGLVRHLTEVERGWLQRDLAGVDAPPLYYSDDEPDGDFDDVDGADAAAVEAAFEAWRDECRRSRDLVARAASLDEVGRGRREGGPPSLRWVLVHLIEEYARHNGHADLLRQCLDGTTGD